jgi:hypothetical protein
MFLENNCLPFIHKEKCLFAADHSTEIPVKGGGSMLVLPYGLFVMLTSIKYCFGVDSVYLYELRRTFYVFHNLIEIYENLNSIYS